MVSKGHDKGAGSVSGGIDHGGTPTSSYVARRSIYNSKHRARYTLARLCLTMMSVPLRGQ